MLKGQPVLLPDRDIPARRGPRGRPPPILAGACRRPWRGWPTLAQASPFRLFMGQSTRRETAR